MPGPRPVRCDVWRIWSQKKGNAAWHQKALKEIGQYYKCDKVPGLTTIKLKSDGQRAQFKGHKNLGATAEWPHPKMPLEDSKGIDCLCLAGGKACNSSHMKPGQEISLLNDFPPSHHGSGPVDNYSNDARRGMDADVAEGKLGRYNYVHCYDWRMQSL